MGALFSCLLLIEGRSLQDKSLREKSTLRPEADVETYSFRRVSSTDGNGAQAASVQSTVTSDRWTTALEGVEGQAAYFAALGPLASGGQALTAFTSFLELENRIDTHNQIVHAVEEAFFEAIKARDPDQQIPWEKSGNYMVTLQTAYIAYLTTLGFDTASGLGDYIKRYTFPGFVTDFTPSGYQSSAPATCGRDADRETHTLVTNGLDWSKYVHPSAWGLFLLTPYKKTDLDTLRSGDPSDAPVLNVFSSNPPHGMADGKVKVFSGSGNTRNQFQRFKKDAKIVTFSVKGGGIDCTRAHRSDYPDSFRNDPIKGKCKHPRADTEEWLFDFREPTLQQPYSVIGGMEARNMGDFDAYNEFFAKMSGSVPAPIKRTMAQGYAVVAIPFIYVEGWHPFLFTRHKGVRQLQQMDAIAENQYLFQAVTWSEAESSLRWTAKLPLCSIEGGSEGSIGCSPPGLSDPDTFCDASKIDHETYRIKTYANPPLKDSKRPAGCTDPGEWTYFKDPSTKEITVCTKGEVEFDAKPNAYVFDFKEELKEWKAVVDQVLEAVEVPATMSSDAQKVAYKLLYSILGNLNAFIQSGFSSSPGGESFDPRNFGVGPRDSGDWGVPVRNEVGMGVVAYVGHTDIADVRVGLYSLPVMFDLCQDTDFKNMLDAAETGLKAILRGVFNHAPADDPRVWKRMYTPSGNENRWIFPLMVGKNSPKRDELFQGPAGKGGANIVIGTANGFLFRPNSANTPAQIKDGSSLYEFEKICACVDDDSVADPCKSIFAEGISAAVKDAVDTACKSAEATAIREYQQAMHDAHFAPLGEKVATTWTNMLAKEGKCKWGPFEPKDVNGVTACPDAAALPDFPELKLATEAGHIKEFNDKFNAFLKKHVPAIMKAALTGHTLLEGIFTDSTAAITPSVQMARRSSSAEDVGDPDLSLATFGAQFAAQVAAYCNMMRDAWQNNMEAFSRYWNGNEGYLWDTDPDDGSWRISKYLTDLFVSNE